MIYITGDCHGDWYRFNTSIFPEQKEMTRDDFVIVCGDFGIWHDTDEERYWLDWLAKKNFTLLFVDGNHENFDRLYSSEFETVDFHGGKAHKIRENIYHLMRGYVFELQGKKFFAFGGASSHDIDDGILDANDFDTIEAFLLAKRRWRRERKIFRVNHETWWKQEMPSQEEMERGIKSLAENNNEVDFVITHCAPQDVVSIFSHGCYAPDELTSYFGQLTYNINFGRWFFGHYHDDMQIMGKFIMLYEQIIRII